MAVAAGKILYVGDVASARAYRGESTRVFDLGGKTVLPGLIDSHTHPVSAAMIEFDHELPEMQSIADVLAYIRDRAEVLGEGKWIVIQQVFITRLEEKRYPTRDELDSAAPNNPVVFRTGPDASLNSQALTHFNIGIESKDPEGSKIERDSVGNPTGILRGWSRIVKIPDTASSSPQQADRLARLQTLEQLFQKGKGKGSPSGAPFRPPSGVKGGGKVGGAGGGKGGCHGQGVVLLLLLRDQERPVELVSHFVHFYVCSRPISFSSLVAHVLQELPICSIRL